MQNVDKNDTNETSKEEKKLMKSKYSTKRKNSKILMQLKQL